MDIPQYKQDFIHFLIESNALSFGSFTLKSGRVSPYFINAGKFFDGSALVRLGSYYASALIANIPACDIVFGPAYKGIPLAVATAAALFREHNKNIGYAFNRKEAKDHGEGGVIIGTPLSASSNIAIVDDVITAGTAMRETMEIFKKNGNPHVAGILILVDRMEKGQGATSAVQDLETELGIKVHPIVTVVDIMEYLHNRPINGIIVLGDREFEAMAAYRKEYGVKD